MITIGNTDRWTPEQTAAIAHFLDRLCDAIWHAFAADILRALHKDAPDPRQLSLPLTLHDEIPF